jgi:hypothetical protein
MDTARIAAEPRVTAWDNLEWVLTVMHHPHELVLLERMARGEYERLARPDEERARNAEAARAGKVAGNVLAVLYVLDASPWHIPEPSLAKAVHVAEKLAQAGRHRGAPRGHTKIEACYDDMRPVAHLWAASRLHWELASGHEELMRNTNGIRTLLAIARGVQEWALKWKPSRASESKPLLGGAPWLVPNNIPALRPRWPEKQPGWLLEAASIYKRRSR